MTGCTVAVPQMYVAIFYLEHIRSGSSAGDKDDSPDAGHVRDRRAAIPSGYLLNREGRADERAIASGHYFNSARRAYGAGNEGSSRNSKRD